MSQPRPGSSPTPPRPEPAPAGGADRLRLTRARLQALLDVALDPLALLDAQGTILYASGALARTLGYGRRELAGRSVFDLVHPDDLGTARASFDRAVRGGPAGVPLVVRCRTAAGSWRTLAAQGASHLDDPQVGCVVVSARDVTEEALADELLREREARLRALAEKFPLVLWTTDGELQLTSLMGAGLAGTDAMVAGEPAPEALGGAEAGVPARDAHARALEGVPATFGFMLGDRRFEAHVEPLRERDEIAGVMGIALDVTERVRAERELRARERELRDAQKLEAIGRLAAGIAHDFNNILTGVLGNASLLLHDLAPDDPSRGQAEAIERVAVRGAEMVGQLLAFSRRQVARPVPLDVNDVVRDAEQLLRGLVPDGVEYVADLDERLRLVHADAGQLERVLVNLAGNACDAMPEGGRLTIATRNVSPVEAAALGTGRGPHVALSVADTGTGIDAETLPQVFEPFFTTKRMGSGTGLGLPTARGIVEQAGGLVRVETEAGRGSTFTVYLPCAAVEARAAAPAARGAGAASAVPATVLVVDDDADVRDVVARTLLQEGYAVRTAADGVEALVLVEQEGAPIDALVTDLAMPGLGGAALAARILQLRPGLPVVFVSATGEPLPDAPGAREGVVPLLPKPFTGDELVRVLARALEVPPAEAPPGDERWSPAADDLAGGG